MAARFAWVLNLDADLELAAIASGAAVALGGYAPKRSVVDAMRRFAPKLAASLLDPHDDVLVDEASPPLGARGLVGRAFCPTPRALRLLRRAGAEPEPHPAWQVLLRVNSRAFASSLGTTLPCAVFVADEGEARALLGTPPPPELAQAWRVKRNFGMTGRGQRIVAAAAVTQQDLAFVRAGLSEGGVQIEPDVTIVAEFAIHGLLGPAGALTLGPVVKQHCDARGAWVSSERLAVGHAPAHAPASLASEAERVAAALSAAGYFGPFGVDAYTYRVRRFANASDMERDGAIALQPRSEINARYTMGFAAPAQVGTDDRRPETYWQDVLDPVVHGNGPAPKASSGRAEPGRKDAVDAEFEETHGHL
jgi:hypothetical protein